MRNLPGFVLATLSLFSSAATQQAPGGVAGDVLTRFDLTSATVQSLDWTAGPGGAVQLDVALGGVVRTLALMPYVLRADDYQVLVDDGQSVQPVAAPEVSTLRGVVVGIPGSRACATVSDGRGAAFVSIGSSAWSIEPVPLDLEGAQIESHVVYEAQDVVAHPDVVCGGGVPVLAGSVPSIGFDGPGGASGAELAIDCDHAFFTGRGSSIATAQAAALAIVNGTDVIYQRDTGICYTVSTIIVRTVPTYTSGLNLGCGGSGLLQEARTHWQQNHTSVARDAVHVFSGLGSFSGTIGCAYNSVVCSSYGFGVSRVVSSNLMSNVRLVCHELGHNWSAPHCNGQSTCRIMCSNLSGCTGGAAFSPTAITQITAFRNSRACLAPCNACATPAGYSYFGAPCVGSGVSLSHSGTPTLGGAFQIQVGGAPSNSNAVLLWGQQPASLDLAPFGAPGCVLYVDGVFNALVRPTTVFGAATWNLQLPSDPGLCGMAFPQQVVVADPFGNALQVAVSGRGVLTFGS